MDEKTIYFYETHAQDYAKRFAGVVPCRIYELVRVWFKPDGKTLDIGAGSGRDTAWLAQAGYEAAGLDAAPAMVAEAKARYGDLNFRESSLPELAGIEDSSQDNLLACAVLMHVPSKDLLSAVMNMLRVLRPNGVAIVSFRTSTTPSEREPDGRLFTAIEPGRLAMLFESLGARVELRESGPDSGGRAGITWHTLVVRKSELNTKEGIARIQDVLERDKKTATYKLALIRSFCAIAKFESHSVVWNYAEQSVLVPMNRVAVWWLAYYWPLVNHTEPVRQTTSRQIAFFERVRELGTEFGAGGLANLMATLEEGRCPRHIQATLKQIAATILKGPVTYSGGGATPIFSFEPGSRGSALNGHIRVPERMWLDISRFYQWIEDSVVMRWAQLTERINKDVRMPTYLSLLVQPIQHERTTAEIRAFLNEQQPIYCVWTGKRLTSFDVDHMIPYSVWANNDLWNLLPAQQKVNHEKRDRVPQARVIEAASDRILSCWERYRGAFPSRFDAQVERALGANSGNGNWQTSTLNGLIELSEKLIRSQGKEAWHGVL